MDRRIGSNRSPPQLRHELGDREGVPLPAGFQRVSSRVARVSAPLSALQESRESWEWVARGWDLRVHDADSSDYGLTGSWRIAGGTINWAILMAQHRGIY